MKNTFNQDHFEAEMRQHFDNLQRDLKDPVVEAAAYSLFSGGKRMRPRILQLSYELFTDAGVERCRPFQFALEMIHTYSLIHDDLPAMDNDTMRRGKPSCHIAYGEATAILAGDLLLNLAYETMIDACLRSGGRQPLEAMNVISRAAGASGIILFQAQDIAFETRESDSVAETEELHELKTAALFKSAILAGAILGGSDTAQQELLLEFGNKVGLAFQIRDDLLDSISNEQELGKSIGKDERDNKKTYLTVQGHEAATQRLAELNEEAKIILFKLEADGLDTYELRQLTEQLETRKM